MYSTLCFDNTFDGHQKMMILWYNAILGDPGADSGGEGKSKRAEKIWHEEK